MIPSFPTLFRLIRRNIHRKVNKLYIFLTKKRLSNPLYSYLLLIITKFKNFVIVFTPQVFKLFKL